MKSQMFNQDVVRHIMDGTQVQDRSPLKIQPPANDWLVNEIIGDDKRNGECCFVEPGTVLMVEGCNRTKWFKPRHKVGDIIGVRERARLIEGSLDTIFGGNGKAWFSYEADHAQTGWIAYPKRLKPMRIGHCVPNGCFKELIRTFLKVTAIRFEQVQSITDKDIMHEGVDMSCNYGMNIEHIVDGCDCAKDRFVSLWESIYPGSWKRNEWVEVTEFELTDKPN